MKLKGDFSPPKQIYAKDGNMTEWMKCSDHPPPEGKYVLTFRDPHICTAEILYVEDDGEIHWLDGGNVFRGVTHWMPLPDPPHPS